MNVLENYFDIEQVPDYCSKEFLEYVYEQYLHNLKMCPYKTRWVTLDEIEEHPIKGWQCIGDKYLEDSADDKMKLAFDVFTNGTYFPIYVLTGENGKYKLRDGAHRLYSMRELIRTGLWSEDKKILVTTDELIDGYDDTKILEYHLPMMVVDGFKENYKYLYNELESMDEIEYVDENKYFAKLRTTSKGYLTTACISLLLRNAFFDYRERYGKSIETSRIINSISHWVEWRGY